MFKTNASKIIHTRRCRMGPEGTAVSGVVDEELKVHGIEGLRMADAGVIPNSPAAHLQAPVVLIAEKCADMTLAAD